MSDLLDRRTTDVTEFDKGDRMKVHFRTDPSADSSTLSGNLVTRYNEHKALIEADDGTEIVVNFADPASPGGLREFRGGDDIGRPLFAEHPA